MDDGVHSFGDGIPRRELYINPEATAREPAVRRTITMLSFPTAIPLHVADGVTRGIKFSANIKNIAAQEPFADLQDRLVGLAEITERVALERKSIMVSNADVYGLGCTGALHYTCATHGLGCTG